MKLKNKLTTILGGIFFLTLILEILLSRFYSEKYFKFYKIKSLEKINFIEEERINYKKLEEYKINKNAQVQILNKNNNKFINLKNLGYLTLKINKKIKIVLLSPFLNKLYVEKKFSLKENSFISVKVLKLTENYYMAKEIFIKNRGIIDYEFNSIKNNSLNFYGKILTLPNKNISENSNEILESFFSNKHQVIMKEEGPYKIIIYYKFKPLEEVLPPLMSYLLSKTIILIIITLILGKILEKKLINPIIILSKRAHSIGNLNFKNNMEYKSKDEIGNLYGDMENMAEKLEALIEFYREEVKRNIEVKNEFQEELKLFIHEIKTPLTAIIGFSDLYLSKEKHRYISTINLEGKRILRLTQELLERKNVSNRILLRKTNFNLTTLVELILKIYEKELRDTKILFQSPREVIVHGDREKIEQVIENLLKNALEHKKTFIRIKLEILETKIKFSMENDGKKIFQEDISKIWKKYFTTSNKTHRGLGLYISSTIIKLHGNKYAVDSTEEGTIFSFYLDRGYRGDIGGIS